jgi:hypothetical protein
MLLADAVRAFNVAADQVLRRAPLGIEAVATGSGGILHLAAGGPTGHRANYVVYLISPNTDHLAPESRLTCWAFPITFEQLRDTAGALEILALNLAAFAQLLRGEEHVRAMVDRLAPLDEEKTQSKVP